jgi:hypothetical protein
MFEWIDEVNEKIDNDRSDYIFYLAEIEEVRQHLLMYLAR